MNEVHIHLLLNHAPVMGTAFGALLLFYGLFKNSRAIIEASMLAFIITALFAIPVFLTGEPAEESIENIPGIVKSAIETHEENAEVAFWLMEALGIFSLLILIITGKENKMTGVFTKAALVLSLVVFGFMAKVGNDGGKIRHPEISNTVVSTELPSGSQNNEPKKDDKDDDD
jgi:hypothetical protein